LLSGKVCKSASVERIRKKEKKKKREEKGEIRGRCGSVVVNNRLVFSVMNKK